MRFKIIILFIIVLGFSACATYSPQFKSDWENPPYPSDKKVAKTFYLVGDAGLSPMGGMSRALGSFQNFIADKKTEGSYTLFLGDNIYPKGMYPPDHPRRKDAENMIDAQYKSVKDYKGQVIFIPGNHEWYNGGPEGVEREQEYIEKIFDSQEVFKPRNGCGMETISVSENIHLIMLDTQWMLEDWNKHPTMNAHCDIKTREEFLLKLKLDLEKNQHKTVVFAMHHPMYTNGNHGGYFALAKHLYPLQEKIPMPVLASLVVQIRAQGGVSVQDRYNELYNRFMVQLQEMAKNNPRLVFVSGHDHNLQYIEKDGFNQIVSGAGSKESYAATGEDGYFSTGEEGFAVLDVFEDGSSWVRYYIAGKDLKPRLIFQKEVIPVPKKTDVSQFPKSFPSQYTVPIYQKDSIREALFFTTIWGAKYKNAYSKPVTAPVAVLDTLFGGLQVIREVKGKNYNSLLLEDKKGNKYRMRAMAKKALNVSTRIKFEESDDNPEVDKDYENPSLKDQNFEFFTASHPYAELAVPKLSEAAGVFYTIPHLLYVPKQKALGNYNDSFGNALYLISLEPSEKSEGEEIFEYPDNVETTDDLLQNMRKSGKIFVDEEKYIKSRLFDMLIGNWDREPGQWQWARYRKGDKPNVFVPIPTNRDNAFSSFEGNILDLTQSLFSGTKQFHVYHENLTDLQWFNKEGVILDRAFIRNSGRGQWKFLAQQIAGELTDEIIDQAFKEVPEAVRDESLEDIKEKLKGRRDNLVNIADNYYTYLAYQQTIVGTDYDDHFEITRLPDGKTNVRAFTIREGVRSDTLIDRTFSKKDTKEIWIYGLDGNDTFIVEGEAKDELIFTRLIGGRGKDVYRLKQGKRIKVYDYEKQEDTVVDRNGGNFRFTNVYNLNTYDYRKQIERSTSFVSAMGYNPDDGFRAAVQFVYRIDNFQRNPFSQQHIANVAYFTRYNSFEISYNAEFANIKNDLNLDFGTRWTSPTYSMNFFGFGNETSHMEKEKGFEYNRVEVQQISGHLGLLRNSNFGSFFKVQTLFDAYKVRSGSDKFIVAADVENLDKTDFFGSIEGIYSYRSYDDRRNPTIGMMFDLIAGATDNLEHTKQWFGYIKSRVGFYNSLIRSKKLVLMTNFRYQTNIGNNYRFYQAASLGGENGLRGFREQRFSGKSMLVGSADLRYSFPSLKINLYPLQVGIYGGADFGRVWQKNETSTVWHNSYGGGLWLNGSGGFNGNFSWFSSKEGSRIVFGLGFDF